MGLARRYAGTRPAMIVLGGSSMHKGANGWQGARAVACLPALTGNLGVAGGGLGPRHGSKGHGFGLTDIALAERRPPGDYVPNQMPRITEALETGRVRALLLFGTDMLSSFADSARVEAALARQDLIVSHELFWNDTARRFADVVLPGTSWLEELGCKATNTHLYLMEPALPPAGQTRPGAWVLQELARRLGIADFYPWADAAGPIDAILDHPATGHATVAALRAEGGIRALRVSSVGHPDLRVPHAVRKGGALLGARGEPRPGAPAGARGPARPRASPSCFARGAPSGTSTASTTTGGPCRRWPRSSPSRCCGCRPPTRSRARWRTAPRCACSTSAARCAPAPA